MLTLRNLSLHRGTKALFESCSLTIHACQKVGVVGANGSGKSTLFALLRGELHQDGGDLELPPRLTIAHVSQETPALAIPALDFVLQGDRELCEVQADLVAAEAAGDGERIAALHARYDTLEGYTARARAGRLLSGLGFANERQQAPVRALSGGWRVRLNLAQALMCRSDMLLLDEPTNHLDLDAVIWLEEWLAGYRGTLLLISHDRDLLDNVVSQILHLERGRMTLYTGGYSSFEEQRAAGLAQQQAAYLRQQKERARVHGFVDRFRAKATKARQAQSRLKALERMELISPAHVDSPFRFAFPPSPASVPPLLRLERVAAGYGGQAVVEAVDLVLNPGDRVGLLGPNGAGKSTLTKLLAGELGPMGGKLAASPGLRIGYFAQHQLEQLRPEDSPLMHLARTEPEAPEQVLRDFLGGFGFSGDAALAPVLNFSGGERARLVLLLLVWQRPNLLLLDEPTNHLDLEMRLALTLALQDFSGAMVLVTHDRALVRATCDRLLLVADAAVGELDGDLNDYRDWLCAYRARREPSSTERVSPSVDRKEQRRAAAEQRQRLQPLSTRLRALEAHMAGLGAGIHELEQALAEPRTYADENKERLKEVLLRQARLRQALAEAEQEWLELSERLEGLARE